MATKHFVTLDTETAGSFDDPRVYDLGWNITDSKGAIVTERRYVIRETWENAGLMGNAYYADKIPTEYIPLINRGALRVVPLQAARLQLLSDLVEYQVNEIYAYNARFDCGALDNTIKVLSNGYVTKFLPANVTFKCIWGYAQDIVACTPKYVTWCLDNGYLSEKGTPETSAEKMYRYLTGNAQFTEAHTALEDVKIESYILHHVRKHHGRKRGEWKSFSRWERLRELRDEIIKG